MSAIIEIKGGVTRHPGRRMARPVDLTVEEGEQIAIAGDNAAGKSRLVDIITGRYPLLGDGARYDFGPGAKKLDSDNMRYITFRDSYGEGDATYYYQQRWNQHDIDESSPLAGEALEEARRARHAEDGLLERLVRMFRMEPLLDKRVVTLSSGELRKLQLARALLSGPRVLIMDNPFIGLDAGARDLLRGLLERLTRETRLLVILVLSKTDDIPAFVTHVLPVEDLELRPKVTRREYEAARRPVALPALDPARRERVLALPPKRLDSEAFYPERGGEILKFRDVTIRYGSRTILDGLTWTVREGERWALEGENGSGKSTLLSLVCADNPQAYACDIELFGHRRGTGESIWEIKRHIGYVSPEMHRAYLKDLPAEDIVASGLSDSVGLYARPRPEQREACLMWMDVLGIKGLEGRGFLSLSSGEQRLCLLARAFVKDPELLILDEPLHGLDLRRRAMVREVIETFCRRPRKTLVMVTHYQEELPPCIDRRLELRRHA